MPGLFFKLKLNLEDQPLYYFFVLTRQMIFQ